MSQLISIGLEAVSKPRPSQGKSLFALARRCDRRNSRAISRKQPSQGRRWQAWRSGEVLRQILAAFLVILPITSLACQDNSNDPVAQFDALINKGEDLIALRKLDAMLNNFDHPRYTEAIFKYLIAVRRLKDRFPKLSTQEPIALALFRQGDYNGIYAQLAIRDFYSGTEIRSLLTSFAERVLYQNNRLTPLAITLSELVIKLREDVQNDSSILMYAMCCAHSTGDTEWIEAMCNNFVFGQTKQDPTIQDIFRSTFFNDDPIIDRIYQLKNIDEESAKIAASYLTSILSNKILAEHPGLHLHKSIHHMESERWQEAIKNLTSLSKNDDTTYAPQALLLLSHAYRQTEDFVRAEQILDKLILKHPHSALAKQAPILKSALLRDQGSAIELRAIAQQVVELAKDLNSLSVSYQSEDKESGNVNTGSLFIGSRDIFAELYNNETVLALIAWTKDRMLWTTYKNPNVQGFSNPQPLPGFLGNWDSRNPEQLDVKMANKGGKHGPTGIINWLANSGYLQYFFTKKITETYLTSKRDPATDQPTYYVHGISTDPVSIGTLAFTWNPPASIDIIHSSTINNTITHIGLSGINSPPPATEQWIERAIKDLAIEEAGVMQEKHTIEIFSSILKIPLDLHRSTEPAKPTEHNSP